MCGRSGIAARMRGYRSEADVGGREIDSERRAHGPAEVLWEVTDADCPHCGFSPFPSRA